MIHLAPMERDVLEKALAGDHPVLSDLRRQLSMCQVSKREMTGCGFFADLHVAPDTPRAKTAKRHIIISDVTAEVLGLKHGAGFVVYVDDGILMMLEGFSYDEPWPDRIESYTLDYMERDRHLGMLDTQ